MTILESEIVATLLMDERLRQAELHRTARMATGGRDITALIFTTVGSTLIMAGSALRLLAHRRRTATIEPLSADLCHGCPR
jgi:NhaP-type Na+/H+ or K+/H+ antiporter